MGEISNELIFETLKAVQADLSGMKTDMAAIKENTTRIDMRLKTVEAHMTGFMSSARYLETEIDTLRGRIEALEEQMQDRP